MNVQQPGTEMPTNLVLDKSQPVTYFDETTADYTNQMPEHRKRALLMNSIIRHDAMEQQMESNFFDISGQENILNIVPHN